MDDLDAARDALRRWLAEAALPFQTRVTLDRAGGGFHERIAPDGAPVAMPRRARVSARQLYAFSRLSALGCSDAARPLAAEALWFLKDRHLRDDGAVIAETTPDGTVVDARFDLYDVAFTLFALASADPAVCSRETAEDMALRIHDRLAAGWRHPEGGFEEAVPRALPLRANPHMHLLEAAMAWIDAGSAESRWGALADETAELCLARFIDGETGAVRELFDGDWRPLPDDPAGPGGPIEPGHQYEWGWLLARWSRLRRRDDAAEAALRMIRLAETYGLRGDGLVASSLTGALETLDPTARLWPQTERVKAWIALGEIGRGTAEARAVAARAAAGLMRFFEHPCPGNWWENIGSDGAPLAEPGRTSSFYHIVCAFSEIERVSGRRAYANSRGA